jgi:hypothetical protein
MEKKQTAVDWLLENLNEYNLEQVAVMAREMEKEQHIETWKRGSYSLLEHGSGEDFERYYKETYGSI